MPNHYPFANLPLPYANDALKPYLDRQTMRLHHDSHLQAYIDRLNSLLQYYPQLQGLTPGELVAVAPSLPEPLASELKHSAGGVYNHRFFFSTIGPVEADAATDGDFLAAVEASFGNRRNMLEQLQEQAQAVAGSGYAWLVLQPDGTLAILTTADQETPLGSGVCPLLNVDVWEHAYYLKHHNRRGDYLSDWAEVVNWPQVERNYRCCRDGCDEAEPVGEPEPEEDVWETPDPML